MNPSERMRIVVGDITREDVDAIVNAANSSLLGGGGVDGAIHRAAGRGLVEECRGLRGCDTGDAKITGGHNLRARHVIHTVGPVWRGGERGEEELLRSCYRRSLQLAVENHLRTVAFPAISCGVYGYPLEAATEAAVNEVATFLASTDDVDAVHFVCFDERTARVYEQALAKLAAPRDEGPR